MSPAGLLVRTACAAAALAALPLVSGCVAAIPVVAAGTLLGKQATRDREPAASRGQPRVAIPGEPADLVEGSGGTTAAPGPAPITIVRTQDFSDGSRVEVSMPARRMATPAASAAAPATPAEKRPVAPGTTSTLADGTRLTVVSGPLPAPGAPDPARTAAPGDYAGFTRFAQDQAALPVVGAERRSAMLANAGGLSPARRECSVQPPAVLVDLDPRGATLDPARPLQADPAFAAALAELRANDITIGWVSSVTADRAGAVRKALKIAGLDPAGADALVLVRFGEESKQTRRADVARELCVVAIAGDERADFDELFQYLKSPAAAVTLEPIIGNGWFLIPTPLS